jgi:hypothetical protein
MKRILVLFCLLVALSPIFAQESLINLAGSVRIADGEIQWYEIDVAAGTLVTVQSVSLDFTPRLLVEAPDGRRREVSGSAGRAETNMISARAGSWRIGVSADTSTEPRIAGFLLRVDVGEANRRLSIGDTRRGMLSNAVEIDLDLRKQVVWYPLQMPADRPVEVLLESDDFDAYLFVLAENGQLRSDDDSEGSDSRLVILPEAGETVMVGASSAGGRSAGVFYLTLTELQPPRQVSLGERIEAEFEPGAMSFTYRAQEAGDVLVSASSRRFDTILSATLPDGGIRQDDDGGPGSDSSLWLSLESGDELFFGVDSREAAPTGEYQFSIQPALSMSIAEERYGSIGDSNPAGSDLYIVSGRQGDFVEITLNSGDESASLVLSDESGRQRRNSTQPGPSGERMAEARYYFESDGSLGILVSAAQTGDAFDYVLRVMESAEEVPANFNWSSTLPAGEPVEGEISAEDYDENSGGYIDIYEIHVASGENFQISLESSDFDSYLQVFGPDGRNYSNDDGGNGLNSLLDIQAQAGGTYLIHAGSLGRDDFGTYQLTYRPSRDQEVILDISGVLGSGYEGPAGGPNQDEIELDLASGDEVSIRVSSNSFDTVLRVLDPSGDQIAYNDDFEGTNSRVDFRVQQSGTYIIIVTPFSSSGGEYQLTVFSDSP